MEAKKVGQWSAGGWGWITCVLLSAVFASGSTTAWAVSPADLGNVARQKVSTSVSQGYVIRIDVARPALKLYRDDRLIRVFPIALGAPTTQTPIGNWHIIDKQEDWGGGFGTRWIGLDVPWGTYGIHGTNRPESVGARVSHGCIRMTNSDVEQLYNLISIGTAVYITGNPLQYRRDLEFGNVGADVQLVQRRLQKLGWNTGPADGRFGEGTQLAVMLFELAHGMPMDAIVGNDDYVALGLSNPSLTKPRES